jgi:hypothetical protein
MRRMTDGFGRRAAVPLVRVGEVLTVDGFADEAEVGKDQPGADDGAPGMSPLPLNGEKLHHF